VTPFLIEEILNQSRHGAPVNEADGPETLFAFLPSGSPDEPVQMVGRYVFFRIHWLPPLIIIGSRGPGHYKGTSINYIFDVPLWA